MSTSTLDPVISLHTDLMCACITDFYFHCLCSLNKYLLYLFSLILTHSKHKVSVNFTGSIAVLRSGNIYLPLHQWPSCSLSSTQEW